MTKQIDSSILEMALIGYQAQLLKNEASMTAIRKQLRIHGNGAMAPAKMAGVKAKRILSAAAIKRIADAQKKRWAAFHAKQKAPTKAAKTAVAPRRKLSPAAKAKLVANLAKARAVKAAKAKAAAA
jgi:hypothetical protein